MQRRPVVAGQFYPLEAEELKRQVDGFLADTGRKFDAKGVIAPHAGYVYSGGTAGKVFSSIYPKENVLLLGPNHTGLGDDISVYPGSWETPLGISVLNERFASRLLAGTELLRPDPVAHRNEHSLEVQVPFLQRMAPDAEITAIAIKRLLPEDIGVLARAIVEAIGEDVSRTLILASSDMSHYETRQAAKAKDSIALEKMLELDGEGLYRVVLEHDISMCGYLPVALLLSCMKEMGVKGAELIEYTDSGHVTGDTDQVVSYAGMVFF